MLIGRKFELLACVAWIVSFEPVSAQQTQQNPGSGSSGALEEIVVTAQKRAESVENVPITINAFTGTQLAQAGIQNAVDLPKLTPGLVVTDSTGVGQLYLRGIGTDALNILSEGAVGVYIDGVYQASPTAALQQLADVQRVEVLKGPQGTLYGRNTTGGAVNVITRDPVAGFTADSSISYGNLGATDFNAYVSGGTERLAGSLTTYVSSERGYLDNLWTGKELNSKYLWGFRGKLKWSVSDDWTVTLEADDSGRNDYSGGTYANYSPTALAVLLGGKISTDPRSTYSDLNIPIRTEDRGVSLHVRGDLGFADLVSISSGRRIDFDDGTDVDGSNLPLEALDGTHQINDNFSEELQLVSHPNGPLDWIVGAYVYGSGLGLNIPIFAGADRIQIVGTGHAESYALYTQETYHFDSAFSATVGMRESYDGRSTDGSDEYIDNSLVVPGLAANKHYDNFSPKLTLSYQKPNNLIYATVSTGYKSGAFDLTTPNSQPVNPEKMTAYEFGGKHQLLDGAAHFNWSTFYYDYKDLQVSVVETNGGAALLGFQNAGVAQVYGEDVDLAFALSENFNLSFGAEYLHGRYKDFDNATVYIPNPATGGYGYTTAPESDGGATGKHLQRAPTVTANMQLAYTIALPTGKLRLAVAPSFNSGYFLDVGNTTHQGSFVLLDAHADYKLNDNCSIFLFGRNLTNRAVIVGNLISSLADLVSYNEPRVYGLGVTFHY